MVHSGYHPLKHRPLRIVLGWCTVDITLLNTVLWGQCLDGAQWISSSYTSSSQDSVWMVHSGYHPLKHRRLREELVIVLMVAFSRIISIEFIMYSNSTIISEVGYIFKGLSVCTLSAQEQCQTYLIVPISWYFKGMDFMQNARFIVRVIISRFRLYHLYYSIQNFKLLCVVFFC